MRPWTDDYVGLPYLDFGRDRNGLDCWGLYMLIIKEQFGIDVPEVGVSLGTDVRTVLARIEEQKRMPHWHELKTGERPTEFDGVLMNGHIRFRPQGLAETKYRRLLVHIACYVSPHHILQCESDVGVTLQDATLDFNQRRIVSVHRFMPLLDKSRIRDYS